MVNMLTKVSNCSVCDQVSCHDKIRLANIAKGNVVLKWLISRQHSLLRFPNNNLSLKIWIRINCISGLCFCVCSQVSTALYPCYAESTACHQGDWHLWKVSRQVPVADPRVLPDECSALCWAGRGRCILGQRWTTNNCGKETIHIHNCTKVVNIMWTTIVIQMLKIYYFILLSSTKRSLYSHLFVCCLGGPLLIDRNQWTCLQSPVGVRVNTAFFQTYI